MGVVRADEEETYGDGEQELLRRRVLIPVVDLLPHVEVVVGAGVELEGHAAHVVEHQVAAEHVGDVGHGPGGFLRNGGDDVVDDFEQQDDDDVDHPGALHVDPVGVEVGVGFLVAELLEVLGRLVVHQAAAASASAPLFVAFAHFVGGGLDAVWRRGVEALGEGDAAALEDGGRHFGGVAGGVVLVGGRLGVGGGGGGGGRRGR